MGATRRDRLSKLGRAGECALATGGVIVLALAAAAPARAALGRGGASVEADRAHMAARRALSAGAAHTVNALTLPNGEGTIREFTRADGTVFAVSWQGPGRPDLRQLLGDHFDAYQAVAASPARRRMRAPVGVTSDALVVHSGGHPGAFFGFAYLPGALPDSFSLRDLQ